MKTLKSKVTSYSFFFKLAISSILILFSVNSSEAQSIKINEIMSSNGTTIADADGDYSDWIELYNTSDQPINLEGFGLSDDEEVPMKWVFPTIEIKEKGFLLVWASGKDKFDNGQLHTNFSISAAGEPILLTDANNNQLDVIPSVEIQRDFSYGRQVDGEAQLVFFVKASPGVSNTQGEVALGFLSPITPSVSPGFYPSNLSINFSVDDPKVEIYYTLDGSTPSTNSQRYTGFLNLSNRSEEDNYFSMIPTTRHGGARGYQRPRGKVAKGTVIRTLATLDGHEPLEQSFTYFVFPEGRNRYSLPVFSFVTDEKNLFSDETGIYVPGNTYDSSNPHPENTGNYFQRGEEWERPANISLFAKDGNLAFQDDIGLRIHGGITRQFPQKALRVYFRSEYGNNSLEYKLFRERDYSGLRRFLLRASGNDFGDTYFRDAFAQRLVSHLDVDYQAYEPSIVFINGEYWGIHNIRERQDKYYLSNLYGVDPDNVDILTGGGGVEEGDNSQYRFVLKLLETANPDDESSILEIEKYIDLSNHIDYMISQIYFANTDWPQNNIDYWRERVEYSPNSPKGRDGRFRWILYDTDHGLSHVNNATYNSMEWVTKKVGWDNSSEWPNFIFRSLLAHQSYRNRFINRFFDNLNTTFNPERTSQILKDTKQRLDPEIEEHLNRWIEPGSIAKWEQNVNEIDKFVKDRPNHLISHIKSYFKVDDHFTINLDISTPNSGSIKINTMEITKDTPGVGLVAYPWQGTYLSGVPIELSPKAEEGFLFDHWLVNGQRVSDEVISHTLDKNTNITAVFLENPNVERRAIYYWFFGTDLDNDMALTQVSSSYTRTQVVGNLTFVPAISPYPGEGSAGIMDRVNDPTEINFKPTLLEESGYTFDDMRGLRVRNPLQVEDQLGYLIIDAPMVSHEKPKFSAAVSKTNNGPEGISISYRTSIDGDWTTSDLSDNSFILDTEFGMLELDFDMVEDAKNNPEFQIRIDFEGNTASNSGNVRFNNIAIEAFPLRGDDLITDLPDFPKEESLPTFNKIYPNPFSEKLYIEINEKAMSQISYIQILDIRGIEVGRLENITQTTEVLDMGHLSSGLYIINVLTRTKLESFKIIKN